MGESGAGVDGAPEEHEPDEAERLIRPANPHRPGARLLTLLAAAGMIGWGLRAHRRFQTEKVARKPRVVRVSAGMFHRGAAVGPVEERPERDVHLSFCIIDLTEVTVATHPICADAGRCRPSIELDQRNRGREGREDHPISCVD